jgi:GR25 family glycosyltransferase involved in LPS biosynthesis
MKGYILHSIYEPDRQINVSSLQALLPHMQLVEAVYPAYEKIPLLNQMIRISGKRTGKKLRQSEMGCLMSHRRIWRDIVTTSVDNKEHFLVLESDSVIMNKDVLEQAFEKMSNAYDLFFWGAWDGHIQLFRSTKKEINKDYTCGEPYIKTVYCTYGYSLNRKAAAYLLKQTRKIQYPVDQFKRYLEPGALLIGGVQPELVSTTGTESYIKKNTNGRWYIRLFIALLTIKNKLICSLK